MLKPPNHTVSVPDLGFIAGYYGMCSFRVGEIDYCKDDGYGVVLKKSGDIINCDIIVKCTGFHFCREVERITGHTKMWASGVIDYNMGYVSETLLDGAQFAAASGPKGSTLATTIYDSSQANA